jgi:hypothetical protein
MMPAVAQFRDGVADIVQGLVLVGRFCVHPSARLPRVVRPCFALGLIEAYDQPCAVLALRPGIEIPPGSTALGFNVGHAVLGGADFELIQFTF